MIYTVHCPCHAQTVEISTPGAEPVKLDDEMMCGHCTCIHVVVDVEPGENVGVVRLARMPHERLVAAYAATGHVLVSLICPHAGCGHTSEALVHVDAPPEHAHASTVMFCDDCSRPMMVEGDVVDGYTTREPSSAEVANLVRQALAGLLGNEAPETPFGSDPNGASRKRGFGGRGR